MSSPYPQQPPKRLERSKSNRVLGGVCAGVANYLNMDPTLVRVLTVVISLFTGVPVLLYIIALFVVPEEGTQPVQPSYPPVGGPQGQAAGFPQAPPQTGSPAYAPSGSYAPGQPAQPQQPPAPPASADDSVWGSEGPPWEQRQQAPEPTTEPTVGQPQPEPTAPSEPEAPVVPAAHEEDATESAPEPEGPEDGTTPTDTPAAGEQAGAESAKAAEGGQQTDQS
jgi:phage shock protein PspC (stress-responsive transcriptional regulator)